MRHGREDSELRLTSCLLRVSDNRYGVRPKHARAQHRLASEIQLDGLGGPGSYGPVVSQDEQLNRALVSRTEYGDVSGPGKEFLVNARELHLNDHAEHGLVFDEEHHGISAELSRNDLGQVGRSESRLGVRGQLEVQCFA